MSKRNKASADEAEAEAGSRTKKSGPLQHPDNWVFKGDDELGGFNKPNIPANVPDTTNEGRVSLHSVLDEAGGSSAPDVEQARASPPLAPTTIGDLGTERSCCLAGRLFQQPARRIF